MKKTNYLNLLLVALTIVIFAGCGKSGSDDKNPIVGKWSYNTGGYTISYTFDNNGTGVRYSETVRLQQMEHMVI